MDMIWAAAANLIHPSVAQTTLVTADNIITEVSRIWAETITRVMLEKHLVSWEDRQADTSNPSRGGSRNRYLFRTSNGVDPDPGGNFRLYKRSDSTHDGWDKSGPPCPQQQNVDPAYQHLIQWYQHNYYYGSSNLNPTPEVQSER